jgi:hypothetical protein
VLKLDGARNEFKFFSDLKYNGTSVSYIKDEEEEETGSDGKGTSASEFSCSICNKTFTRRYGVDRHMSSHSEARPFKYPVCQDSLRGCMICGGMPRRSMRGLRSSSTNPSSLMCFYEYDCIEQAFFIF